jgi:hypothetical protein
MISALEHRAPSQQLAFAAAGATAKEQKVQGTWCSECALIYQLLRHRPLAITQPLSTEQLVPHDGAQAREPTNQGKPTCPQYHKLGPYKSCLVVFSSISFKKSTAPHPSTARLCCPHYAPLQNMRLCRLCSPPPIMPKFMLA